MQKHFFCLLLVIASCYAHAQVIDTAVLKSYPASVIVRVHDIASKVSLSSSEQQSLANLFSYEEQELRSLALNGASASTMDSMSRYLAKDQNSAPAVPVNSRTPPIIPELDSSFAIKDCAGVENGFAYKDNCGYCVGGTTGKNECICPTDSTFTVTKEMLEKINPLGNKSRMDSILKYINLYKDDADFQLNTR